MLASAPLQRLLYAVLYPAAFLLALSLALPVVALLAGQSPPALAAALRDPATYAAIGWTLAAAAVAVAGAVVLGLPLGYLVSGQTGPARRAARAGLFWLQAVPQPALGVGLVWLLYRSGLVPGLTHGGSARGFAALCAAMGLVAAPPLVMRLSAAFNGPPRRLALAARSLGAGHWEAFWYGALPAVRRDLHEGVLAAWERAAGDLGVLLVVVASPVSGTLAVWLDWSRGDGGAAGALALLLLAAVCGALALGRLLLDRLLLR